MMACMPRGQHARQIAGNAAAGDVGHGGDPALGDDVFEQRPVAAVRHQQFGADLVADFGDVGVRREPGDFKDQLAGQRIAVGVQAERRQREQHDRRRGRRWSWECGCARPTPTMNPARS